MSLLCFGKRKTEHDYTKRYWGHDYIFTPRNGGLEGHMQGWGEGLREGDFLILENLSSPSGSTRYQIMQISYYSDPSDMWSAEVKFAPRKPAMTTTQPEGE